MVSKRRISYQWRMFLPLAIGLWIAMIAMGLWVFSMNSKIKRERVYGELNLVNESVKSIYTDEEINNDQLRRVMRFVYDYYRKSPEYKNISISLYDNDELIVAYGTPIPLPDADLAYTSGLRDSRGTVSGSVVGDVDNKDGFFYFNPSEPDSTHVRVITAIPYSEEANKAIEPNYVTYVLLFSLAVVLTLIAFFSSRHIARNIKLLREVAKQAATDPNFMPAVDFPHDELGDINRQIVHIFNERSQAMKRQKREHAVALHAIEDKAQAKRQMSSNINHELRTPISVIKGYLDTIMANPDMDPEACRNFVAKAQNHADRLVSLIQDVSAITRLEDGADRISTSPMNFHDLVFTLSSEIEESHVLDNMVFNYDIPMDCDVMGNYNLLSAMIMNLARNSAAYSKGTMCELLYAGEDGNSYIFVFRDNGVGVGEEHLSHLFERFYRVDSGRARKAGGTGLGLSIVESTVTSHGGTITVENRPEGGLSFRFTLPKANTNDYKTGA